MTDIRYPKPTTTSKTFKTGFSKVIASGVDPQDFTSIVVGAGQTVSQSGGNLVFTSGTTINSETIIRSTQAFTGEFFFRSQAIFSQRISNQTFYCELVDVVGDLLPLTVNSATSISVTIPDNPFTAENVGQSIYFGNATVVGAFSGRYAIASVAGTVVTFTVSGFPASGTGTCSLFGWNYYQKNYFGSSATSIGFDTQRRGWNSGVTFPGVNTTLSPGHMTIVQGEESTASLQDQIIASQATIQGVMRASRVTHLPDESTPLYIQYRVVNGTSAPASSTTWTVGMCSMETYTCSPVALVNAKPQSYNTPQPVQIQGGMLGTVTTVTTVASVTSANFAAPSSAIDAASGAITSTQTSAAITPTIGVSYRAVVPVTAVSGTSPTLDVSVEESGDGGATWSKVYDFPRITAVGVYQSPILKSGSSRLRYVQTIGGTTPSFTRSITRTQLNCEAPPTVQLISRTIVPNTLSSTTGALYTDNIFQFAISCRVTAQTTPATIALEFSDDGTNWWTSGTTLATVVGISSAKLANEMWKFVRATVTAAGTGITLDYLQVKGYNL